MQHLRYNSKNITHTCNNEDYYNYRNDNETYCTLENDPDFNSYDNKIVDDTDSIIKSLNSHLYDNTNTFMVPKNYISMEKSFIRFDIDNIDFLDDILKEVSNIVIEYNHGGTEIFSIHLLLNFILMKEYGLDITIIDVEQFLSSNTDDEINNLIFNGNNFVNCKYVFGKETGYYLDIPLIEDFYIDGIIEQVRWHTIKMIIHSDKSKIINKSIIGFEKMIYSATLSNNVSKVYDNRNLSSRLILRSALHKYPKLYRENIYDIKMYRCKFIFVIIKKSLCTPSLKKVSFDYYEKYYSRYPISIENTIMYDFNDTIVYGISTNPRCNMNDWSYDNDKYYTCVDIQNIYLEFDHTYDEDIQIITIEENLLHYNCGMVGCRFNFIQFYSISI
jgi:hypothetical protein